MAGGFWSRADPTSARGFLAFQACFLSLAVYGDAKLPDLLVRLANCPPARGFSVYDRCRRG
jgi:hypothetical protein